MRDRFLWAGVLIIALFVGADGYEAWQDYRSTIEQSERAQLGLSRALAEQAARMVQELDVALSDYSDWSTAAVVMDRQAVGERLNRDLKRLPFVHSIAVVGADGQPFASTNSSVPGNVNLADRAFFKTLEQTPADTLYIGGPYLSRRDQYRTFAVSRRIHDRNGAFAGVIVARVAFEYLTGFYASLTANGAAVRLIRDDGVVLASYPQQQAAVAIADDAYVRQALAQPQSSQEWQYQAQRPDVPQRLVTLRKVQGYPLVVEVSQRLSVVLQGWRQQELMSAARTLTLAVFAAGLLAGLYWMFGRRDRLEQERRRLERELKEMQKAEAVGFLAASMAHDFNNVLSAIVGYAEMARNHVEEPNAAQSIDRLLAAGERARLLVRRVLTFDPHRRVNHVPLDIDPVVAEALDLVRSNLPRSIVVQLEDRRSAAMMQRKFLGDATEVHQVLMNLCTNALRAMPEGGRLELRLECLTLQQAQALTLGRVEPGDWLCLSVIDSGVGLAPDQLESVFEPFYTTRPIGQGTGIGLTVVRNIVKSMGGAIRVESHPGVGTSMSVYWRLLAEEGAALQVPEQSSPGRGQSVLIADDEPDLVTLAEEMVASLGYEAIGFSDSRAALEAFRRAPGRFDAVLVDERMPILRGTALARAIHDIRPELPVILVTGWRGAETDLHAQQAGVMEILEKPLRAKDLQTTLGRAFRTLH